MTAIGMEIGDMSRKTPYERFQSIWYNISDQALSLRPDEELRATMAALALAGNLSQSINGVTLDTLLGKQPLPGRIE